MSEHYDTAQECPKCGLHHDTDDEWCDGLQEPPTEKDPKEELDKFLKVFPR